MFKDLISKLKSYSLFILGLLILCVALILISALVYKSDEASISSGQISEDLIARRKHLIEEVAHAQFSPAQSPSYVSDIFKIEWAIGTMSMTSLALANIAFIDPTTREQSLTAIESIIEKFLSKEIRAYELHYWGVDALDALGTENGQIGYLGHFNLALVSYLLLGGEKLRYVQLYQKISERLIQRINQKKSVFLETFPNKYYLPDNLTVYASIAMGAHVYSDFYAEELSAISKYLQEQCIDLQQGLIQNWVDADERCYGGTRGSYAAWNNFFSFYLDAQFAKEHYQRVKANFLQRLPLGFNSLREYPVGKSGKGDIDSGPVILGQSTSGTGFIIGAATQQKDILALRGLLRTADLVGTSFEFKGKRSYVVAPLIADAIMLAMKSAGPLDSRFTKHSDSLTN